MKKNYDNLWDFILFLIAILLLNLVAVNYYKKIDLTAKGTYSLSESSKSTVKNLEEPLSIQVFFSEDLPSPYNNISQHLEDLLQEYDSNSSKFFSYNFFDMNKEDNIQLASDYGLHQIQIRDIKTNEVGFKQVWMGLVITYGNRTEILDGITTTDLMEYNITTRINKMISTVSILSGLKGKISLNLYCSDSMKQLGINGLDKLEPMAREACNEVNKKNMNRLEFKAITPAEDDITNLAAKYGIHAYNWENPQSGKTTGTLGLVLEYADSFKVIPVGFSRSLFGGYAMVGMDNVEMLSESITSTMKSLVAKTSDIGYTIGHSESFLDDNQTGGALIANAVEDRYKFKDLDLQTEDVPSDLQCILINGAKDKFTEAELYRIDQFVMKGGNLIVFADSFFEQLPQQQNYYYSQPTYTPIDTGLDKLLNAYGITVNKDYVLDEECLKLYAQDGRETPLNYMPQLTAKNFGKKSVISKGMGQIFFAQASSIDVTKAENDKELDVKILAKSSDNSWLMKENITTYPAFIQPPKNSLGETDKTNFKSENLAVLVEGKFSSAFESSPVENNENDSLTTASHLSKGVQKGKVIVVSSSKMTGTYLYTLSNFLQSNISLMDAQQFGPAQVIFIQNIIDYMNGEEDLCAMRNKGLATSNIFVVEEGSFKATLSEVFKYFNMIGLAVLTVLAGVIIFIKIQAKKSRIRNKYNPDDEREIK